MPLCSILGHDVILAGLRHSVAHERVAHAYLFSGPDGVGKRRVALAFLQLLSCLNRQPGPDACGACRPCRLLADGRHPDLVTLERDGQFIKIDQVREVVRMLRFPPVDAAVRAVIVHDADAMNDAAANALLKTLEEPAPRNVFVLLSSRPNAMLATIRSRCQQVRFGVLPRETVAAWLTRERGLDAETADEVAGLSEGSLAQAERLVDPKLEALRNQWLDTLQGLPLEGPTAMLALAEDLGTSKDDLLAVIDVLRSAMRDVLLASVDASQLRRTFPGRRLPVLPSRLAHGALTLLAESESAVYRNVNPRLVAEHVLFGLRRAIQEAA